MKIHGSTSRFTATGATSLLRRFCLVLLLATAPVAFADESSPDRYDLVILVDNSSAAAGAGLSDAVIETLKTYIGNLPDASWVGLIAFDDLASVQAQIAPMTAENRPALLRAIDGLTFSSPHSNVGAGLERALYELDARGDASAPRSVVLVQAGTITTGDAEQDESFKRWAGVVLAGHAKEQAIPVFALTIGEKADQALVKRIAANTFGAHFHADDAAQAGIKLTALSQRLVGQLDMTRRMMIAEAEQADEDVVSVDRDNASKEAAPAARKTAHTPALNDESVIAKINEITETQAPAAGTAVASAEVTADPLKNANFLFERTKQAAAASETTAPATPGGVDLADEAAPAHDGQMMKLAAIAILASGIAGVIVFLLKGRLPVLFAKRAAVDETREPGVYLRDIHGVTGQIDYPITERLVRVSRTEGRNSPNVVCVTIADDVISREHAFIEYVDGVYWVIDPGSNNGTFVNEKRIQGKRKLKAGDRLRFAVYEFSFDIVTERARSNVPTSRTTESTQLAAAPVSTAGETQVQSSLPDAAPAETVRVSTGNQAAIDKTEVRSAG